MQQIVLIFSLLLKENKRLVANLKQNNLAAAALIKSLVTRVIDCVSRFEPDSRQLNTW